MFILNEKNIYLTKIIIIFLFIFVQEIIYRPKMKSFPSTNFNERQPQRFVNFESHNKLVNNYETVDYEISRINDKKTAQINGLNFFYLLRIKYKMNINISLN